MFEMSEIIWYLLPFVVGLVVVLFRRFTKPIGYAECILPFSILSIEMINQRLFDTSIWPYVLFGLNWIGVILLLVNYKRDYYFTVGQFSRKYLTLISICSIGIFLALGVYHITILVF